MRLIVMDMWKLFRNVARERAPQAAILFDKFHVMKGGLRSEVQRRPRGIVLRWEPKNT
ncbi:MAG: transposase [Burkholderia sp.]